MELKKLNMLHEDVKDYDGTNYVVEWFGSLLDSNDQGVTIINTRNGINQQTLWTSFFIFSFVNFI